MFGLWLPLILVLLGAVSFFYAKRVGPLFCRIAKAQWKVLTLGRTDLGQLYPEDKAPKVFRLVGLIFLIVGLAFGSMEMASLSGPGQFAAMDESKEYLERTYDVSGNWELSTRMAYTHEDDYLVIYTYGSKSGVLHARWNEDHYVFTEHEE